MNQDKELKELFENYLLGKLSPEELESLLNYFQSDADPATLRTLILNELEKENDQIFSESHKDILSRVSIVLENGIKDRKSKVLRLYLGWGVAAAILLFVGLWVSLRGTYTINTIWSDQETVTILPGEDKATLVLEDGSIIALDNNSEIEGKDKFVFQDESGMMTFNSANLPAQDLNKPRTVSTPKGGQFAIILADGTKVWLNAASSITFPALFDQDTRHVDIEGEVYFEVAKNASKPFIVTTRQQTVRVIGTHFNINSYPENKAVKTGLLEGRVAVQAGGKEVQLMPGQVSYWEQSGGAIKVENIADMESLISWKDGVFSFTKSNITEIMQVISRWYDVDFVFEDGDFSDFVFEGMIPKKETIQQVLKILSVSQELDFEIKGKKVIVSRAKNVKN